jgi:hypothetical protein
MIDYSPEDYWKDGYNKLHKEYSSLLRENSRLKEQIDLLVADKMLIQNELDRIGRVMDSFFLNVDKMNDRKDYD